MQEYSEKDCFVNGAPGVSPYIPPPVGDLAVVTGGSGNLGPVWIETLREMGYRVHNLDLPQYDVSDRERMQYAARRCIAVHGVPSVIVVNAGVDAPPGSQSTFFGNAKRIMEVNYLGALNTVEVFLPALLKEKRGNVTFIGSMYGFRPSDPSLYEGCDKPTAYGGSKAALWHFCCDLNKRHAKQGLVFNMLVLSGVDGKQDAGFKARYAEQISIGRMLKPEDFIPWFKACVTSTVPCDMPVFSGGGCL